MQLTALLGSAGIFGFAITHSPKGASILAACLLGLSVATIAPATSLGIPLVVVATFTSLRLHVGDIGLPVEQLVAAFTVGVLVIRLSQVRLLRKETWPFLAWGLLNLISSLAFAEQPLRSLGIASWIMTSILAFSVFVSLAGTHPDLIARLGSIFVRLCGVMGWVAAVIWVLAATGDSTFGVEIDPSGLPKVQLFAREPNLFGSQMLVGLIMGLYLTRVGRAHMSRWMLGGLAAGLVASMTRAVWLGALLIALGTLFLHPARAPRRSMSHLLRALPILILAGGIFWASPVRMLVTARADSLLDLSRGTGRARITTTQVALTDMQRSPSRIVTGFGTNSFGDRHYSALAGDKRLYLPSFPIVVLHDTGLLGLGLVTMGFGSLVLARKDKREGVLVAVFILALLIPASATNPFWFVYPWVGLALLTLRSVAPPTPEISAH